MLQISSLSSIRVVMPKDLLPLEARENTLKKVSEILARFGEKGVPLLDPEDEMHVMLLKCIFYTIRSLFKLESCPNYNIFQIKSSSYKKASRRIEALENLFDQHEIARSPLIAQKLKVFHMKQELNAKIKSIKKTMRSSTALAFKDELKARKRVLRRIG